jgi:pSer/pThr/pTyr-binding forkhead associated (FHA) protein
MSKGSYRLTVKLGPMPGKVYEIARASVTLGRDVTNDLVVNDAEVSRRHVQITAEAEGCRVEDLASTNGTFIDGRRITQPALLKPGQVLGVGETVTLELSFTPDPDATLNVQQEERAPEPAPAAPSAPPVEAAPAEPAPKAAGFPTRWIVIGCGCLTLLACVAAIAVGILLWNAPASFWHSLGL